MKTVRFVLVAVLMLLMSACAQKYKKITPDIQEKMDSDLEHGNYVLDCGTKCMGTWIGSVQSLQALDMVESWRKLYTNVMAIGYKQDLAYYYLGQAAQGLGYHEAAIKYYKYAWTLASGQETSAQCAAMSDEFNDACKGVDVVSVCPILIQY